MLDSSCANACALNGLPGPMRRWFTGFTHSLSSGVNTWIQNDVMLSHTLTRGVTISCACARRTSRQNSPATTYKWLGCMLTAYGSEQKSLDLQYHLQQAAKAYHANKWILEDRKVPISQRLRYFDSVVSSVACFAGGHRTMYREHLQTLDIHCRKFCRSIVGPPPYIDWTLAWHEILHTWNERAAHFVRAAKIESWSRMCCGSYWKLASHVVKRPTNHWIRRVLHWQPVGQRRLGRPKLCWENKLEMYCRYQG